MHSKCYIESVGYTENVKVRCSVYTYNINACFYAEAKEKFVVTLCFAVGLNTINALYGSGGQKLNLRECRNLSKDVTDSQG